jgi:hypothetical protein
MADKLDKFKNVLEAMSKDFVTHEDVASFFKQLVTFLKDYRASLDEKTANDSREMKAEYDKAIKEVSALEARVEAKLASHTRELVKRQNEVARDLLEEVKTVEALIPEERNYTPEFDAIREAISTLAASLPKQYDDADIRARLEAMQDEINKKPSVIRGWAGSRLAHVPMVDDFSDETDGSTKTFYLSKEPRRLTTTKVWGSDFPYILRYGVDFTIARKVLTLTSEVDAPTSGATLVVEYYV